MISAKGNLPRLNKLAKKTGFDPRLVNTEVRKGVEQVKDIPDISGILDEFGVKIIDNYQIVSETHLIKI
ncbi:MAG: hypothetical protein CM15mV141_060 [uncultured marine virus]|nr:MAG: hypothetical protein CM15mV141_060 [uncultured marine virus]